MTTRVAVQRTPWAHPDAMALRAAMTAELRRRYADRPDDPIHRPPDEVLVEASMVWAGVAYTETGVPVGHAALRRLGPDVELKRMYVTPAHRGRGVADELLAAVRAAAVELGAERVVLQTGDRQPDAVHRYLRAGYRPVPTFPPYQTLPWSRCFALPVRPNRPTKATVPA
jgi:GNAT superfamily N-acetyltransferase